VERAGRDPACRGAPDPGARLPVRAGICPADAARSFPSDHAGRVRTARGAAGRSRVGRDPGLSAGYSARRPGPTHRDPDLHHVPFHDAGLGHAAQPGADRNDPRGEQARLAARCAGSHGHADGRAVAPDVDRAAAARSSPAGSAAGRGRGAGRFGDGAGRRAREAAACQRPGAAGEPAAGGPGWAARPSGAGSELAGCARSQGRDRACRGAGQPGRRARFMRGLRGSDRAGAGR